MATVTSLGFSIFSTYSGRGVSAARRDLADLNRDLDNNKSKLGQATTGFFSLTNAALALGPALIPISVGIAGATAGLGAMATAAGVAGAGYAFFMDKAITSTLKLAKAHKDLTPIQQTFVNSVNQMKAAMNGVSTGTMNLTLRTATIITQGLTAAIRQMTPLIKAVAPVADQVANAFKNWAAGNGMKQFIQLVIATGVPALKNLLQAGRDVIGTLGDGFRAMAPTIIPMSKAIADGAASMRKWADNGGFANFMQTVHDNGPAVKQFFEALAGALHQAGGALAGLGPAALSLSTILLKIIAATPIPVLQAIVVGYEAMRIGMLAYALATTVATVAQIAWLAVMTPSVALIIVVIAYLALLVLAVAAVGVGIYFLVVNWSTVWNAIKATFEAVYNFLTHGLGQLVLLLLGIPGAMIYVSAHWQATWSAMKTAAQAVWNALKIGWTAFINAMNTTWVAVSGALKSSWNATWNAMKTAAQAVWNALKAAWSALFSSMSSIYGTFSSALKGAWNTLWNTIKSVAQTVWNAMVAGWRGFFSVMSSTYGSFSSALKGAWQTMWNTIKSVAQTVWTAMETGFKAFSTGVQGTLNGLVTAATTIWNKIVGVFKTPIKAVVTVWNVVAGVVGLGKINLGFASGGHVQGPGGPTDDKIPAMLSNGEFVMSAKAVSHYGVDNMYAMNAQRLASGGLADGSVQGTPAKMALGGIIPNPINVIKGAIGAVFGAAADVVGFLKNNIGTAISAGGGLIGTVLVDKLKGIAGTVVYDVSKPIMDAIVGKIPDPIPGVAKPAGSVPHAALKKLEDAALSKLKAAQAIAVTSSAVGPIPAGAHKQIIDTALAAAHIPPPGSLPQWEAGVNTIINRESSWNPNAINLTDSNAKAGHPSQGLMQTIPSTFAAYHVAGTSNNILDPVANIAAACRYIVAVYGNISNVQQANPNLPPKGYRNGTDSASKGWHMIDEDGGEWINFRGGEKVLPHGRKPKSGEHGGRPVQVHVENHWHGNPDEEAVQYAESDMCDSIRQAVHAGVGGGNY